MQDPSCRSEIEQVDIELIARAIVQRGLETPAIFLLEAHRPLRGLFLNVSVASAPFLALFAGAKNVERLQKVLESSGVVDKLIEAIEKGRHQSQFVKKEQV